MSAFPNTRWSVVSAAGGSDDDSTKALDDLCRIYRPAVLAFAVQSLLSALGDASEAEDLTQEFFADLLARRRIEHASRTGGKFRTYLLAHFKFVLLDHLKRRRAEKRGGGALLTPIHDLDDAETPATLPDSAVFDVEWAGAVVRHAVHLLEAEHSGKQGDIPFDELKGFLPGFQATGKATYEELAARYGASEGSLRVRINRLRARFKELINAVLAETVSSTADLEAERQALLGGLLRSLG